MKKLLLSEKEYSILLFVLLLTNILLNVFKNGLVRYTEILSIVVFVVLVLINLKDKKYYRSSIYIFIFASIIITYSSTYINNSNYLGILTLPVVMLLYFLLPRKINYSNLVIKDTLAHIVIIVVVAALNIMSLADGSVLVGTTRLSGVFGHPNSLSMYNLCAIFSIVQLFIQLKIKTKYLLGIPFVFCLYVIYRTGSRTGMLVAAIFIFLCFALFFIKTELLNKKTKIISAGLTVIVLLILFLLIKDKIFNFLLRGSNISNTNLESILNTITSNRYYMWTKEFPYMMENNWLIGNGVYSFLDIAFDKLLLDSIIVKDWLASTHNFILDIIFVSGITGLFLFLCLVVSIFIETLNNYNKANYNSSFIAVKVIVLICIFCYFSFEVDFLWYNILSNLYLLMIVGMIINVSYNLKEERESHE